MDHNIYTAVVISIILHHVSRPLYNTAPLTSLGSDDGAVYSAAKYVCFTIGKMPTSASQFLIIVLYATCFELYLGN